MSDSDLLIERLAQRGGQATVNNRLVFALPLLAAGFAVGISLLLVLGQPLAMSTGASLTPLLVKWAFTLVLTGAAALALFALAHPGQHSTMRLFFALVPLVVVGGLAFLELTGGLGGFPGETWQRCVIAVGGFGLVGFVAAIYATRLLAPVRLRHAGFAAGLFGGGLAASGYAPFCPEHGALYVLMFYGGPIMALAAFGWLTGPRLLRW